MCAGNEGIDENGGRAGDGTRIDYKKMSEGCEMSGYTKTGKVKKHAICNTHTFLMKPSNGTAKFRTSTKVNLCPILNK